MSEQGAGERMVRLELKYCECCGGLLLRRTGGAVVYCGSCVKKMNELPARKGVRRVGVSSAPSLREGCGTPGVAGVGVERTLPCGEGCGTPGVVGGEEEAPVKIGPKSVGMDFEATEERRRG